MSQTFPTGLRLSEYVQVVCQNTIGTCLKSVSKHIFSGFQGFPALKETVAHIERNGQFWTDFGQMGKTGFFSKKRLEHFFLGLKP